MPPRPIVGYVAQPNSYGCAIACVAMIVGKTYDEMESWLLSQGLPRGRMEQGLYDVLYLEALDRHGFVYVNRWRTDPFRNGCERSTPWPPTPFAPCHICCADVAAGHHAFVMLDDGAVLDPYQRERTSINHPDYDPIDRVIGIWGRP